MRKRRTKMDKWVPLPGKGKGGQKKKSKPPEYDEKEKKNNQLKYDEQEWLPVRKSQIKFYTDVPLYKNVGKFVVYKHPGEMLDDKQIAGLESTDQVLYIKKEDKITAIREVHQKFNQDLEEKIQSKNLVGVKSTLMNIVEETLTEPRSGSLQELPKTIDLLVNGYAKQPYVIRNLAFLSFKDYTTTIHSINVMALILSFCLCDGYSLDDSKALGLSALLHDLGKMNVPKEILTASRKLTLEEFKQIQNHTSKGYDLLKEGKFDNNLVRLGALEHHEKLDGSGYPKGATDISQAGQLIGIFYQ